MATILEGPSFKVRPYRPDPGGDRDGIRAIFNLTGLFGDPVARYFPAPGLIAEAMVDYYLQFEADWILVAEDNATGQLVGYIFGCPDTARRERIAVSWQLPRLIAVAARHGLLLYPALWRMVLAGLYDLMTARRGHTDDAGHLDLAMYPAHLHMAVHPDFHRRGIGGALLQALCHRLAAARIPGIHLHTTNRHGAAIKMYEKDGFQVLSSQRTTMFDHLLPPEMVPVYNIVMVKDLRELAGQQG
jgi:ribosomal protein S18 acetylase RimI-like enzyme